MERSIKIIVNRSDDEFIRGRRTSFKMYSNATFKNLIKSYCRKQELVVDQTLFKFNGDTITQTETPEDHSMEDGDIIHAFVNYQQPFRARERNPIHVDLTIDQEPDETEPIDLTKSKMKERQNTNDFYLTVKFQHKKFTADKYEIMHPTQCGKVNVIP